MKKQFRSLDLSQAELKFASGDTGTFAGYAATFNSIDSYGDTIKPGAFAATIKANAGRSLPILHQHDGRQVVGKWTSLAEDAKGLLVEGQFTPGNSLASDVYANLKFGALDGLSIGYMAKAAEETDTGRTLAEIDLYEISVVTWPADQGARVNEVKFDAELITSLADAERCLRDAGMSRAEAKAFIAKVKSFAATATDSNSNSTESKATDDAAVTADRLSALLTSFNLNKSIS